MIKSLTSFGGGISSDSKNWLLNSCRFSRNLDITTDSDSITLHPKPVKDSGVVVTDLVKHIVDASPYENARYALGDTGNIYKIVSNVWTLDRSGATVANGAAGQGLVVFKDYLYYATATTIGRKGPLSGTSSYNDDFLGDGIENLDITATGSGNTYTTPTSISEAAANLRSFIPSHDPIKSVQVNVIAKGSGDVTLTLHDTSNNTIATKTIAAASMTTGNTTFTFTTPARIIIGNTYHFHIISTVADTTIGTGTASNLSAAYYSAFFGILATSDNHPMIQHTNGVTGTISIGNDHYIAEYDGDTYNPNTISLEPGFKPRSMTKENEFIVLTMWRGNSVDATETGRMYYWDGISLYYNYSKEITSGLPNAIANSKNRTFSILGSSGDLALGTDPFRSLQAAPKLTSGSKVEVLPGAITVWQKRVHFGYSETDDTNAGYYVSGVTPPIGLEPGIYEFGSDSDRATSNSSTSTEVLNFAYTPSTAIANPTNFAIGCCEAFGKDFYFSVQDGASHYVDRVEKGGDPAGYGSWESLIFDKSGDTSMPFKEKELQIVGVSFLPLPVGCSVTPKYRINRATAWTFGTAATVGAKLATVEVNTNFYEMEYGFDVVATVNYPTITSVFFEYDPRQQERGITK